MRIQPNGGHTVPVIVAGNNNTNSLGVVRNLGRHGIPIIMLDYNRQSMVRYSRYISRKLTAPSPKKSETQFVDFLLNQGKQMDEKCVIIPTNDVEVMALSRYKDELEQYYLLPIPSFEVVQSLVNKRNFYQLLGRISIPYPKTYFPADISELKSIGQELEYPYIIKPVYMHLFLLEFGTKCFVIKSPQELNHAIQRLENKELDVMIQEIIPGKEIYMLYTYFNREAEPVTICGYDKLRQYPPDFGIGSLCRSAWRSDPIDSAIQVLKALKYHGMAEPELKKDPRDGVYKLLEINARTTTQSGLPAACGVNTEYAAYLDTIGQYQGNSVSPQNGIIWIDEISDAVSCLRQIIKGTLGIRELAQSLRGKKAHATAAWDDPLPFLVSLYYFAGLHLKLLFTTRRQTG